MLDTQENKIGMFLKVHSYLLENDAIHNSIPLIAESNLDLRSHIDTIFAQAMIADADMTGTTVVKANKRTETTAQLLKVAGAINIFGASTSNFTLIEQIDATESQLSTMRDSEFYKYSQLVASLATPITADLVPFGVTAADITSLKNLNEVFLLMIDDPKSATEKQKNVRESMVLEFEKTDELLHEKMDRYMRVFETTQEEFYRGYGLARSIDDTGASTTPDFEDQVLANSTKAIGTSNYLDNRTFKIKNTGSVPLTFYLTNDVSTQQGNTLVVQGGETRSKNSKSFNTDATAIHLVVSNPSLTEACGYKVYLQE